MNTCILKHNGHKIDWSPVIRTYTTPLKAFLASSELALNETQTYLPLLKPYLDRYQASGFTLMYEEEMKDIASILGVDWTLILALQLAYESFAACTSAVLCLASSPNPVHFRTMDWAMPLLKDLTVHLVIQNDRNETLWEAIGWAGCVGVLTGVKTGLGSISVNYRPYDNAPFPVSILGGLERACQGAWPVGHLVRDCLEHSLCFSALEERLTKAPLIASTYLTLGSPSPKDGRAVRIIRSSHQSHVLPLEDDDDCLVQTNADFIENQKDTKNVFASKERVAFMKSLNPSSVKDLISQVMRPPVLTSICLYACIMDSSSSSPILWSLIP